MPSLRRSLSKTRRRIAKLCFVGLFIVVLLTIIHSQTQLLRSISLSNTGENIPSFTSINTAGSANTDEKNENNEGVTTSPSDNIWPPKELVDPLVDPSSNNGNGGGGIVILIVNCGYIDMADNLIASMIHLGFHHYVLVPLDKVSYNVMNILYPGHVVPPYPSSSPEAAASESVEYGSRQFHKLTSTRASILKSFLEVGYTIYYCDLDTVWNKNALEYLSNRLIHYNNANHISKKGHAAPVDDTNQLEELVDINVKNNTYDPLEAVFVRDSGSTYCTCQIYMKPTLNNLNVLTQWEKELTSGRHSQDQRAFNVMMNQNKWKYNVSSLTYSANSQEFPVGRVYFKQRAPKGKDEVKNTVVVHNNFIVGHDRKVDRFGKFGLWNPSGRLNGMSYNCSDGSMSVSRTTTSR